MKDIYLDNYIPIHEEVYNCDFDEVKQELNSSEDDYNEYGY